MKTQTPYRSCDPDQLLLLAADMTNGLPQDHLAYLRDGAILVWSRTPGLVPLPTFLNFQRAVYRIYEMIRSFPTGSCKAFI